MDTDARVAVQRFLTRLSAVRTARGLSAQALATAAGMSRDTVASLETRRSDVALSQALALCRALDVDLGAMLSPEPLEVRTSLAVV